MDKSAFFRIPLFRIAHVATDLVLTLAVYTAVFFLRFEGHIPKPEMESFWFFLPILPAIRLAANYAMGLYSHLWKYVGVRELFSIFKAVTLGSLLFGLTVFLTQKLGFPRSIFFFEWAFYFLAIGGVRFSRRFSNEITFAKKGRQRARTLIVGAGEAGVMVAREMLRYQDKGFVPIGFIDDDPQKLKARIHGLRVFGSRKSLVEMIQNWEIDVLVVAMPSVSRKVIGKIVDQCATTGVDIKIVPATHQIISGEVKIHQLRSVQIEDLLGRDPVVINDRELMPFLQNKRIVVTGAGGSIGSELCRQLLQYQPERLYLIGHGENSIYRIMNEMSHFREAIEPIILDIRHPEHLQATFTRIQPSIIFHAAAHKHVPLMEKNPYEAFLNNVLGTYYLVKAAQSHAVEKFVLISTDKSTEPKSIMGMTKYFAELVVQNVNAQASAIVRFGNVIGSRGSVIPLFQEQIAKGGPITVTHEHMTRYFMTIPEAVQLVLQASVLKDERGIFILDMGDPVNILDLAKNMVRLSGFESGDIDIKITGMRAGEKLEENLIWSDEKLAPTACPQILKAIPNENRIHKDLEHLQELLDILEWKNPDRFELFWERYMNQSRALKK